MRIGLMWMLLVALVIASQKAAADEPALKRNEAELIPAPKQMLVPDTLIIPETFIVPVLPRPGTREGWQYFGVDNFGRFRPRVILSPFDSSYYYQTGEPYPWITNRSSRFMPYVVD